MRYRNAIFDMDGVFIDNSEGIIGCARRTVLELGLPDLPDETYRLFIGPALMYSLKTYAGATEEQCEEGYKKYREYYFARGIDEYRVYDGVEEMLQTLTEAGVKCTVASGKPAESVRRILGTSGLGKYFLRAEGSDRPKKYSDKTKQILAAVVDEPAVMIGDRVFDLLAAKIAGVDSIYALYGFCAPGDTDEIKPTFEAADPHEITDIVLCRGRYANIPKQTENIK